MKEFFNTLHKKMMRSFHGFPPEAIEYYKNIEQHNTRKWFHAHKEEFQKYVMEPARAFVEEMGLRLMTISPYIYAEPKVNRSIFRIARDVRRNKHKPPYKTQLSFIFWEGGLGRLQSPGFYCAFSPTSFHWAVGIYQYSPLFLKAYREALVAKKSGEQFQEIAENIQKKGLALKGKHYKRYPRGYNAENRNAEFLLHRSVYISGQEKLPKKLHSPEFVDIVFEKFLQGAALHKWLADVVRNVDQPEPIRQY